MKPETKRKFLPLALTAIVLVLDQISKQLVIIALSSGKPQAVIGDFFRLTLHRSSAIIFKAGLGPPLLQTIVFFALPVIALGLLVFFYFREKGLKDRYRFPLAAILGGGLGILTDRFLRPEGEIVFLDFKSFGLFGLSRWPAFNLAYLSILAGVVAILVIWIVHAFRKRRSNEEGRIIRKPGIQGISQRSFQRSRNRKREGEVGKRSADKE
jgi:signal peptidase II